jgi:hypothetical protein
MKIKGMNGMINPIGRGRAKGFHQVSFQGWVFSLLEWWGFALIIIEWWM